MAFIKYKHSITLAMDTRDSWYLSSDQGSRYETSALQGSRTPWTDWYSKQHISEIRSWQKEILRDIGTKCSDLSPFLVYKRSSGYSQPHDIALAHSSQFKIWILSTEQDFWIVNSDYGTIEFKKQDSWGSILNPLTRQEIGVFRDALPFDYER